MIKRKYYLAPFIMCLFILSFSITGIWESNFIPKKTNFLTKLPTLPKIGWVSIRATYPFYFTIQSNFLVTIYFGLMLFKVINPNKVKAHLVFELMTFISILAVFFLFWFMLFPFSSYIANWFDIINNFLVHLVTPLLMFIFFYWRVFSKNKTKIKITYKDFWKFCIYPTIWLILVISLYYITRRSFIYSWTYNFKTKALMNAWQDKLNLAGIKNVRVAGINGVRATMTGIWGNAVYFFLNFDNIAPWMSFLFIFVAFLSFLLIIFFSISLTNPDYKINKIITKIIKLKK